MRKKRYNVAIKAQVEVTTSITVSAVDEDEAVELAMTEVENAAKEYDWDIDKKASYLDAEVLEVTEEPFDDYADE